MTNSTVAARKTSLPARLIAAGLSREEAGNKAKLFSRAAAALRSDARGRRGGMGFQPVIQNHGLEAHATSMRAFYVPGRVEFLGKHTDYGGGRSMICAIERGFCLVASARTDNRIRLLDVVGKRQAQFALDPDLVPDAGEWTNYPMTVARRVSRNFPGELKGADIAFASDLPLAAGMSSSSAFIVGVFLAISDVNQLSERPEYKQNIHSLEDLAGYLGTNENGQTFGTLAGDKGVGTFGGSEDHTAILCAQPNRLSVYSYCPVHLEKRVELPPDHVFVIAVSGVASEKTREAKEKYNLASRLASIVLELWRRGTGRNDATLAAAIHSSPDAAEKLRQILASAPHPGYDRQLILDRFEQFYAESEQIIPAAVEALEKRDLAALGSLVDRSQELSERQLRNQVPETVYLARAARELGAVAASAFGAGFGGSVWALVPASDAESFGQRWLAQYATRFPDSAGNASCFTTHAGSAAFAIDY